MRCNIIVQLSFYPKRWCGVGLSHIYDRTEMHNNKLPHNIDSNRFFSCFFRILTYTHTHNVTATLPFPTEFCVCVFSWWFYFYTKTNLFVREAFIVIKYGNFMAWTFLLSIKFFTFAFRQQSTCSRVLICPVSNTSKEKFEKKEKKKENGKNEMKNSKTEFQCFKHLIFIFVQFCFKLNSFRKFHLFQTIDFVVLP